MNLLPITEKDLLKKGFKHRLLVVANILFSVAFLLGIVMLLPSFFLIKQHFDLANTVTPLTLAETDPLLHNILELPGEVNTKLAFFQTNTNEKGAMRVLTSIISSLPPGVRLDSILFSRKQSDKDKKGIAILISGSALNRDSLVSFGNILRETKQFSSVEVPVSSLAKEKDLPFSMNIFIEN